MNRCCSWGRRAVSRAMLLPLALLPWTVRAAPTEAPDVTVTVAQLLVDGRDSRVTDAAVLVTEKDTEALEKGTHVAPGTRIRVLAPVVRVYLEARDGTRFILECSDCSEEEPMEFRIGDRNSGTPFRQERGKAHFHVTPGEGWFKVLFDLLEGPEEMLIPVAVEGTHFLLEGAEEGLLLTVADGMVRVEAEAGQSVPVRAGGSLFVFASGAAESPAEAERLQRMRELIDRWPAAGGGAGTPISPPPPQSAVPQWAPWVLAGAGVAALATGGILHYMAWQANRDFREDAGTLCEGERALPAGTESAQDYYDRRFDDVVSPRLQAAWVLYGAGGAAVGGAAIWLLLRPGETGPAAVVRPLASPTGLGLEVTW